MRTFKSRFLARSLSSTLTLLVAATPLLAACDKGPTKDAAPPVPATAVAAAPAVAPTAAAATPTTPAAVTGTTFGAGVTLPETAAVTVDAILANPSAFKDQTVRVEGMITDVCPKRGCWMELAGSQPGQKLRFKVDDGDMVFPPDAKGKVVVAQGVLAVRELTLEQSKEHAEYQAKEYGIAYDPASITTPTSIVRIDGTGAVLRDQK